MGPDLFDKEPKKTPNHTGHHQRLRARFLRAMGEVMPDYELLELLLILAIPRRDVKPLAKDLIDQFCDFAGVVSAVISGVGAIFTSVKQSDRWSKIAAVSVIVVRSDRGRVGIWHQGLILRKLSGRGVPGFESISVNSKLAPANTRAASTTNPPDPGRL